MKRLFAVILALALTASMSVSAEFKNNGTFTNAYEFTNTTTFTNGSGATFNNVSEASFMNSGYFSNGGTLVNNGAFSGGTMTNSGTISGTMPSINPPGGSCGSGLTWELSSDGKTLSISGSGAMTNFSYESDTTRPPWNSYWAGITGLVISNGVTSIGNDAFFNLNYLETVTIGDDVKTIGEWAFAACYSLTDVSLPGGLTAIGEHAFGNCSSLTGITIPSSVISIDSTAFNDCTKLTSVTYEGDVSDWAGMTLGYQAFPSSLTAISISDTANPTITILNGGATVVGVSADDPFVDLNTSSVRYYYDSYSESHIITSAGVYYDLYLNSDHKIINFAKGNAYTADGGGSITGTCGETATDQVTWTLTGGVLEISGTGNMKHYTDTNPPWADYRSQIAAVTIGAGVTQIGARAFIGCTNLAAITVDESNNVYSSLNGVLFNKAKTWLYIYPEGKTDESYEVPPSVQTIGNASFNDCTSLTSLQLNSGVTDILDYAFNGCTNLNSIVIPSSVRTIGYASLYYCDKLTNVIYSGTLAEFSGIAPAEFAFSISKNYTLTASSPAGTGGTDSYALSFARGTIADATETGVSLGSDVSYSYDGSFDPSRILSSSAKGKVAQLYLIQPSDQTSGATTIINYYVATT